MGSHLLHGSSGSRKSAQVGIYVRYTGGDGVGSAGTAVKCGLYPQ